MARAQRRASRAALPRRGRPFLCRDLSNEPGGPSSGPRHCLRGCLRRLRTPDLMEAGGYLGALGCGGGRCPDRRCRRHGDHGTGPNPRSRQCHRSAEPRPWQRRLGAVGIPSSRPEKTVSSTFSVGSRKAIANGNPGRAPLDGNEPGLPCLEPGRAPRGSRPDAGVGPPFQDSWRWGAREPRALPQAEMGLGALFTNRQPGTPTFPPTPPSPRCEGWRGGASRRCRGSPSTPPPASTPAPPPRPPRSRPPGTTAAS